MQLLTLGNYEVCESSKIWGSGIQGKKGEFVS